MAHFRMVTYLRPGLVEQPIFLAHGPEAVDKSCLRGDVRPAIPAGDKF